LLGDITDTNSAFIAGELAPLGIDLYWMTVVGDNIDRLVEVLKQAWDRSDLIVVTGGLGPTEDDITREGIARMLGEELAVDPDVEKWLRGFFSSRGYPMPERNIKQATAIPSSKPLYNTRGTAPGWWVQQEGTALVTMPGVPVELFQMWQEQVLPQIKEMLGGDIILSRTIKTLGMAEAAVDEALSPLLSSTNPSIGIYAKMDGIHIRITAKGSGEDVVRGMLNDMEAKAREQVGDRVWGVDDQTLEGVLGELFTQKGLTLATMESCTGGLLANHITDVPGSSRYFKGGAVTYTNDMKMAMGVPRALIEEHGAVSPQVAEAMARAAQGRLGGDVGVAITGVAGPDDMEGNPKGTVHIGIVVRDKAYTFSHRYGFPRQQVKRWAVLGAMFQLRRILLNLA
ncbi:MAG: competence/damage-inducible protein A, partial [Dehalococcoidia bacterium]|nr:competence/damage-inducible protein A [Dehalococcoidia bacterium]